MFQANNDTTYLPPKNKTKNDDIKYLSRHEQVCLERLPFERYSPIIG